MLSRRPVWALLVLLLVTATAFFVAGMVGQFNEGPWGGLPSWVGSLSWGTFLLGALLTLLLAVYLAVSALFSLLSHRRTAR